MENEWPIFYIFMIIDGMFKEDKEQVETYQARGILIFIEIVRVDSKAKFDK